MWKNNDLKTYIFIFNVERGLSIFIRTGLNLGIIYDCGSSENFSPTSFIKENLLDGLDKYKEKNIAQLVLSHPHADHISEVQSFLDKEPLSPALVTCPHDKDCIPPEALDWTLITNDDDKLLDTYKKLYEKRNLPLQTINYTGNRSIPNLENGLYYVKPPVIKDHIHSSAQDYSNAVSLVFYLRHGKNSILIPGDITPQTFKYILELQPGTEQRYSCLEADKNKENWPKATTVDQPSLLSLIKQGLSVLVAPHHGLESSYSEEFYNVCKDNLPKLIIISDKRHTGKNDGNISEKYQTEAGSQGVDVMRNNVTEFRHSVSTRNDDHILIVFDGNSLFKTYLEKDPKNLLNHISQ